MSFDIVIRDGRVIDGSGNAWFPADIGIRDGKVAAVGRLRDVEAGRTISAAGKIVSPGFIDVHDHSDYTLLNNPSAENAIEQGVTLLVTGNCGKSCGPLRDPKLAQEVTFGYVPEVAVDWQSFSEYLDTLERSQPAVNVASLVGHSTVRAAAMHFAARASTPDELKDMQGLLKQALEDGAFGLSLGLEYPPGMNAELAELTGLAQVVADAGRFVAAHIRSRDFRYVQAVQEMFAMIEGSGVSFQFSHLTSRYGAALNDDETVWRMIDEARQSGRDITCDMMPVVWGNGSATSTLPGWAFEGGVQALLARLDDADARERLKAFRFPQAKAVIAGKWDKISIYNVKRNKEVVGKTLEQLGEERGCDPHDALLDIMLAEGTDIQGVRLCVKDYVDEEILRRAVSSQLYMFGADGFVSPYGSSGPTVSPYAYGWVARLLGEMSRDKGWFRLEDGIRRLTSFSAQRLGIKDRGVLREGAWADVVVFDAETIAPNGTFFDPAYAPTGVEYVLVNGEVAVEHGKQTGARAGKVLRA